MCDAFGTVGTPERAANDLGRFQGIPQQWNKQVHYSWRFDPRELGGAVRTPERPERPRNVRRCAEPDE